MLSTDMRGLAERVRAAGPDGLAALHGALLLNLEVMGERAAILERCAAVPGAATAEVPARVIRLDTARARRAVRA